MSSYKQRVPDKHKLFGALSQLNTKLGDKAVHWFMEGWAGSDMLSTNAKLAPRGNDHIVWRSKHIPDELVELLKQEEINKVYLVGGKASVSVQIACQVLMDEGNRLEQPIPERTGNCSLGMPRVAKAVCTWERIE